MKKKGKIIEKTILLNKQAILSSVDGFETIDGHRRLPSWWMVKRESDALRKINGRICKHRALNCGLCQYERTKVDIRNEKSRFLFMQSCEGQRQRVENGRRGSGRPAVHVKANKIYTKTVLNETHRVKVTLNDKLTGRRK